MRRATPTYTHNSYCVICIKVTTRVGWIGYLGAAARMLGIETRASSTTHLLLEEDVPGAVGLEPVREQWRREREQHSFPARSDQQQQQREHEEEVLAVGTLRRPFKAHAHIEPLADDQHFYTRVFLDPLLSVRSSVMYYTRTC